MWQYSRKATLRETNHKEFSHELGAPVLWFVRSI
jgi:hypothetical protein